MLPASCVMSCHVSKHLQVRSSSSPPLSRSPSLQTGPAAHPYFTSIKAYEELIDAVGPMGPVERAGWVEPAVASWRRSIWAGAYDPMGRILKPTKYLERMHGVFKRGQMQCGTFAASKKKGGRGGERCE